MIVEVICGGAVVVLVSTVWSAIWLADRAHRRELEPMTGALTEMRRTLERERRECAAAPLRLHRSR